MCHFLFATCSIHICVCIIWKILSFIVHGYRINKVIAKQSWYSFFSICSLHATDLIFYTIPTHPGKLSQKFVEPRKFWKVILVLESARRIWLLWLNVSIGSWSAVNMVITGSIARSANLPVFSLLRGRFWGFSPRRDDTLHRWGWNLAWRVPSSMPNLTPNGATARV